MKYFNHVKIDGVPLCCSNLPDELVERLTDEGYTVACGHATFDEAARLAYALCDRGYKAVAHGEACREHRKCLQAPQGLE